MRIAMIGQKGIQTDTRGGGIERHVEEIARRLVNTDHHDVFVYARKRYMKGKGRKIDGMHVIYLPTVYFKNLEAIVHTFLSTLHALTKNYDVIHYHGVGPSTLAWIPKLFKKHTTVITTFHSQDRFHQKWSAFARAYLRFGEWAAVRFPHVCIAVSHVLQVYCRKTFHRETVYIPNGAIVQNVEGVDELAQFGIEKGGYLVNVGRIVAHKGIGHLIDAYNVLSREAALPSLVIVGSPSFSDAYFELIKQKAAANPRIQFVGFQTGETLRQLFAHAKLFIQPSEYEGLPLVTLEAMSFGVPVLVSDIPENLEAMHHAGFSFENKSVDDLVVQLRRILNDEEALSQARARSQVTVQKHFNWDRIAEHTQEVYRSARH